MAPTEIAHDERYVLRLETEVEALRRRFDMKIHTAVLNAKPGDVLVLRASEKLLATDRRAIIEALARSHVTGVHVIMLPYGASLSKLTDDEQKVLRKTLQQPKPRRKRA